jgi:hypothetical protein
MSGFVNVDDILGNLWREEDTEEFFEDISNKTK